LVAGEDPADPRVVERAQALDPEVELLAHVRVTRELGLEEDHDDGLARREVAARVLADLAPLVGRAGERLADLEAVREQTGRHARGLYEGTSLGPPPSIIVA